MKSQFLTDLLIRPLEEDGKWVLMAPLKYQSKIFKGIIEVPEGFETDLASVPRVPIAYTAFGNRAHREAVVHDYLYQKHLVGKAKADRIFLEAMKVRKKPLWVRWSMYMGVVLGGGSAYKEGPDRYRGQ
jgi:hypothetical protein